MPSGERPQPLDAGIDRLVERLAGAPARILLFGPPGSGKSTLATLLAGALAARGIRCLCLNADPGSASFGVPAALNLGTWSDGGWQRLAFEPLCSLNPARFRLPLLQAVRALLLRVPAGPLLIDTPGVVRGVAAAELLCALADAVQPDLVVSLMPVGSTPCLPDELASLPQPPLRLISAAEARPATDARRARQRTRLWQRYMDAAVEWLQAPAGLVLLGTPPPLDSPQAWQGRIVALSDDHGATTLAEVLELEVVDGAPRLRIRGPAPAGAPVLLLVRDAVLEAGRLRTREPARPDKSPLPARPAADPRYSSTALRHQVGTLEAELVNGTFGDPLLLLSPRQQRRCLLFDLGDTHRLPLRCAHRVTDVFVSHAHLDHIGGFVGLLRARLGSDHSYCRFYGPPGLGDHIAGMLRGMLWDRIDDRGPVFDVHEWHGERLSCRRLQAGIDRPRRLPDRPIEDGVLLDEADFRVRAVELDHGTPVLAFAFEPAPDWQLDKTALEGSGLAPGRWLGELVEVRRGRVTERRLQLPDGRRLEAGPLAERLLVAKPVTRLVYATDLADTPENRRRLNAFARDADTLFCEACFSQADAARAREHSHLTTRACGEIAAAADVRQLVPFHFSKRYEGREAELYGEIAEALADSRVEMVRREPYALE